MRLLVIDTGLAVCQAAVFDGERPLSALSEAMTRGHQERLAPMVREVMEAAEVAFTEFDRVVVTVGPGSFTGVRVGLAFAKGLALALETPCVGVGTLAALAASLGGAERRAAVIDAGRGSVYLQLFDGAAELLAPDILPLETAAARLAELAPVDSLVGPQASRLIQALPAAEAVDLAAPAAAAIARLAKDAPLVPPRPLYLRPPDARVR
ncbi:MAG TPA: tRNA (adenosine(37)-N6)-threonylcarbamoyltransferase complex dimerization subunit type 1 TsaB [Caulobacteraceae bacterium]